MIVGQFESVVATDGFMGHGTGEGIVVGKGRGLICWNRTVGGSSKQTK
jgi:hypothetical protein